MPDERRCAADGGPHVEQGFHFMLPINRLTGPALVPETTTAQSKWRFCGKCTSMFFDGFNEKGACPRGGVHSALGDIFVLPHDTSPAINLIDAGSDISIDGDGFVPDAGVLIIHQFDPGPDTGVVQGTDEIRTDNDGRFSSTFSLPQAGRGVTNIGVQATDTVTSRAASGHLR